LLTIKAHILGERLRQTELMTIFQKMTNWKRVQVDISAGESLVSHVEKRVKALFLENHSIRRSWQVNATYLDQLGYFLPLLRSRIDAGWIMSAGVQQNDRSFWDFLKM
jgi:hypothetical protein